MSGEVFDQNRGLNKQEERDFLKKGDIDQIKQEVGGDLQKLEKTIITNYHSENFYKIGKKEIAQIKDVVGEDFYNQNKNLKDGGAEGISALQILAIKCVDILNGEKVENILKSKYIPSWPVDGILGPNTLYMLKEISKTDLGGDPILERNGVIDNNLLNKMLNICGIQEDGIDDKISVKKETPQKQEEITPVIQEEPVKNPKEPVKEEAKEEEKIVMPEVEDELEDRFNPIGGSQQAELKKETPQKQEEITPVIKKEAVKTPTEPVKEILEEKENVVVPEVEDELEDGFNPIDGSQQEDEKETPQKPEEITPVIQEKLIETPKPPVEETPKKKREIIEPKTKSDIDEFVPLDGIQQNESNTETTSINNNEITLEAQADLDEARLKASPYHVNASLYTQDSYGRLSDAGTMPERNNPQLIAKAKAINDAIDNLVLDINNTENIVKFSLDKLIVGLKKESFDSSALTYETIFNAVNAIKNKETKEKISRFLVIGDIRGMQEYLGMKDGSRYDDNRADAVLDRNTLNRMTNPLFGLKGKEFLDNQNIPNDVRENYKKFKKGNLNESKNYSIISKSDFNMYILDANHSLISVHPIGLGKTRGDAENEAYKKGRQTTPGGMYEVNARKDYPDEYADPGEYVALKPINGQYDIDKVNNPLEFTLGFHNYFKGNGVGNTRKIILQENNLNRRRMSNGCINTLSEGSIYDNLSFGSKVYVTFESK